MTHRQQIEKPVFTPKSDPFLDSLWKVDFKKIVLSFLFLLLFCFVFGQIWCAFLFWAHTQIKMLIVLRSILPDPSSALLQMAGALVPSGCSQTPTALGSQLDSANRGALRGGWLTSLVPDSTWRLLPWTPAVRLLPLTLPPTHGSEFLQFQIPDWPSVPFGFSALCHLYNKSPMFNSFLLWQSDLILPLWPEPDWYRDKHTWDRNKTTWEKHKSSHNKSGMEPFTSVNHISHIAK